MPAANVAFRLLPPADAVAYFAEKGVLQPAFSWQDVWQEEHNKAFTVAKMMRPDLLATVQEAVERANREGRSLSEFARELTPVLQREGWWGKRPAVDPASGRERIVQLGSPARLKLIYEVNLRQAYAAGRWARIERGRRVAPLILYRTMRDERVRLSHQAWDGVALPIDHPWWDTHYPPNGWNCRCIAVGTTEADLARREADGLRILREAPPVEYREFRNRRTGEISRVPAGIDPGWGYNAGKTRCRGTTPEPLDARPPGRMLVGGEATDALPPPVELPADWLLPAGLEAAAYVRAFLAEFGARPGRPAVWDDRIGNRLPISEALFTTQAGELKVLKRERGRAVRLIARAIRDPDELWLTVTEHQGRVQYRNRYLARFRVAGQPHPAVVVFEWDRSGWSEVTAFAADSDVYLQAQRRGIRLWRRPPPES